MEFLSTSAKNTQKFGQNLAKKLKGQKIIALIGELGSGKTTFTQGFAKGLGIKEKILSPTFILMRQHKIPKSKKVFYHLDLYRLNDARDFENLGLNEFFFDKSNIIVIEWAQKIQDLLPQDCLKIYFDRLEGDRRIIRTS